MLRTHAKNGGVVALNAVRVSRSRTERAGDRKALSINGLCELPRLRRETGRQLPAQEERLELPRTRAADLWQGQRTLSSPENPFRRPQRLLLLIYPKQLDMVIAKFGIHKPFHLC